MKEFEICYAICWHRKIPRNFICHLLRPDGTVRTKIEVDPGKRLRESISEKLLILLRERVCLEIVIFSSNFQAFALCAEQTTEISLKGIPAKMS